MKLSQDTKNHVKRLLSASYAVLGTWQAVGEQYGLGKAQVWRAAHDKGCSEMTARKVLGDDWITITIRCQANGAGGNANNIMLPGFELRQCPVTDSFFVVQEVSHQKYRADLSPAVKRAARRDLVKCRVKFSLSGDWGKQ